MFDHFLITRFNIKLEKHFEKDKNGQSTNTELWLNHRFNLFEEYCMPSIIGQSCQDFRWLILFDKNIPNGYIAKIDSFQNQYSNIIPIYLETGEKDFLKENLKETILALSKPSNSFIITTRIDNDDAFHKDFIKEVQMVFLTKQEECFLNFNSGIQYDINKCIAVKLTYLNNHFISRMEKKNKDLETVIYYDHSQIDKFGKVFSILSNSAPKWIEIIHNRNVSNSLMQLQPLLNKRIFNQFNLNLHIDFKNTIPVYLKFLKKTLNVYLFSFLSKTKSIIYKEFY